MLVVLKPFTFCGMRCSYFVSILKNARNSSNLSFQCSGTTTSFKDILLELRYRNEWVEQVMYGKINKKLIRSTLVLILHLFGSLLLCSYPKNTIFETFCFKSVVFFITLQYSICLFSQAELNRLKKRQLSHQLNYNRNVSINSN